MPAFAPAFAVDGGLALVLARGAAVAMLLLAFGTALFSVVVARKALDRAPAEISVRITLLLRRLAGVGLVAALAAMLAWLALQTADFADVIGVRATLQAAPSVLSGTTFGHVILAQIAALIVALILVRARAGPPAWPAAIVSGAALALQAGHGHAVAMDGPGVMLCSEVVHLLAAGAWLGGLPALLVLVAAAPPRIGATGARWFTPLGKASVIVIVASAATQFWALIGGLPGLIGTPYGLTASIKLLLLAVLLGFAAANRYRFAPALVRGERADPAKRVLIRSVAIQTGVGMLAVLAAATLSELPPAMHEQPVWPFALRPSLVALADPDLRAEIARALLMVTVAVALLMVAAVWRRVRWPGVAAALALAWAAAPHFELLFVEAYPTSYYRSPTGFAADSIRSGGLLYASECAACHGADGKGDGPAAAALRVPAADLTAAHLWDHEDGELFWWLSRGMNAPDGSVAMPGFAGRLSADQRWDLIDYVRAHNAGVGIRDTGALRSTLQAPVTAIACADVRAETTSDLRGSVLHLVAGAGAATPPAPAEAGLPIVTVLLTPAGMRAPPGTCASTDPAAWSAFATLAGLSPTALAGTQFLVDPDGWIRAIERPGESPVRWADPSALLADARAICINRVAATASGGHVHH